MATRVAVARIITQKGDERKVIEPGSRFDSAEYGISDDDLKRMEAGGTVRKVRDRTARAPAEGGPVRAMAEGATVEGRSGPIAGDATSDMPNKQDPGGTVVRPAANATPTPTPATATPTATPATATTDDSSRSRRKAADDEL